MAAPVRLVAALTEAELQELDARLREAARGGMIQAVSEDPALSGLRDSTAWELGTYDTLPGTVVSPATAMADIERALISDSPDMPGSLAAQIVTNIVDAVMGSSAVQSVAGDTAALEAQVRLAAREYTKSLILGQLLSAREYLGDTWANALPLLKPGDFSGELAVTMPDGVDAAALPKTEDAEVSYKVRGDGSAVVAAGVATTPAGAATSVAATVDGHSGTTDEVAVTITNPASGVPYVKVSQDFVGIGGGPPVACVVLGNVRRCSAFLAESAAAGGQVKTPTGAYLDGFIPTDAFYEDPLTGQRWIKKDVADRLAGTFGFVSGSVALDIGMGLKEDALGQLLQMRGAISKLRDDDVRLTDNELLFLQLSDSTIMSYLQAVGVPGGGALAASNPQLRAVTDVINGASSDLQRQQFDGLIGVKPLMAPPSPMEAAQTAFTDFFAPQYAGVDSRDARARARTTSWSPMGLWEEYEPQFAAVLGLSENRLAMETYRADGKPSGYKTGAADVRVWKNSDTGRYETYGQYGAVSENFRANGSFLLSRPEQQRLWDEHVLPVLTKSLQLAETANAYDQANISTQIIGGGAGMVTWPVRSDFERALRGLERDVDRKLEDHKRRERAKFLESVEKAFAGSDVPDTRRARETQELTALWDSWSSGSGTDPYLERDNRIRALEDERNNSGTITAALGPQAALGDVAMTAATELVRARAASVLPVEADTEVAIATMLQEESRSAYEMASAGAWADANQAALWGEALGWRILLRVMTDTQGV
jgi:hypothetical protein